MEDSTKIIITAIIAFTIIVVTLTICSQPNNPTKVNEQTRQFIIKEEGI